MLTIKDSLQTIGPTTNFDHHLSCNASVVLWLSIRLDLLTSRAQRARSGCLVPCLEARSAIVKARASERVARASESSTCFPCWKLNQVTSFWRELFRVRSRRKVSIITFPVSYNGSKAMLFCAHTEEKITPTKPFFMFLQFQKIFSLQCGGSTAGERCLTKKVIFRID